MNILSISATFGMLVFVFQWGNGADLLNFTAQPIETTNPVIIFCIVFGLSMDYEVLMLSRIHEEWEVTGDNTQAVANGQTITFAGAANQLVPTVSATDTVTYALRDNVTIAGNFTASGTGTHTLGSITFASSTIASSGSTVTVDDDLSLSAGKTLTADNISSSETFVDFGAKDLVTSGFFYTSAGPTESGIVFEGSTQDAFETLIRAVEPTADHIITVPNETGTIVTTGGNAVVTGTMIALDTVAEANMADDAIGQDQLKSVVTLQILDSGGTVVKTMFGAGA